MSGGSFNYLYSKEYCDLFETIPELIATEKYLLQNNAEDIALDVRRLIEYLYTSKNRITVLHENLSEVLKAIEWSESGDWGKESVQKAIDKYRSK